MKDDSSQSRAEHQTAQAEGQNAPSGEQMSEQEENDGAAVKAEIEEQKDGDELDPLDMDCMDPDTHQIHVDGEVIEHQEAIEDGDGCEPRVLRQPEPDRDQKIGPPILSPYSQINQIDPSR